MSIERIMKKVIERVDPEYLKMILDPYITELLRGAEYLDYFDWTDSPWNLVLYGTAKIVIFREPQSNKTSPKSKIETFSAIVLFHEKHLAIQPNKDKLTF